MKIGMFGLIGAAAVASAASADFTGYSHEVITLAPGQTIVNVYANFSHANDMITNVWDAAITTNHAGGFYNPNESWKAANNNNPNSHFDSWVALGLSPTGNGLMGNTNALINAVTPDPNWSNNYFDITDAIVADPGSLEGPGWYNSNPANGLGFAGTYGGKVLVAHFAFSGDVSNTVLNWGVALVFKSGTTGSGVVVERGDEGTVFSWVIPTPGALALMGLAGFASRRRRA